MNLNLIAKPLYSIVLSGILILVGSISLFPALHSSFATPDFTQDDNTNSLLEGIEPFDNTTSSNVSSSEITSSGGDETASSGSDETASSGGGLSASKTSDGESSTIEDGSLSLSDQAENKVLTPTGEKNDKDAPNNPSALKDERLQVRESEIGTGSFKFKIRHLLQEVVFQGAEAGMMKKSMRQLDCDSDETLLSGGYDIFKYSNSVKVVTSLPSDKTYYLEVTNTGPDALVSLYANCLKPIS